MGTQAPRMSTAGGVMVELMEDTIALAIEDGGTEDCQRFVAFMHDMLPQDIMLALQEVTGSETFLEEIFEERFGSPSRNAVEEDDFVACWKCCEMCEREGVSLTRHHVYPRETHASLLTKGVEKERLLQTITVCSMCHKAIHRFFTNDELAEKYHSLDLLLAQDKMYRFAAWASSQIKNKRVY